jgi:hypothetical protein
VSARNFATLEVNLFHYHQIADDREAAKRILRNKSIQRIKTCQRMGNELLDVCELFYDFGLSVYPNFVISGVMECVRKIGKQKKGSFVKFAI